MEHTIQSADMAPTTAQVGAYESMKKPLNDLLERWNAIKASDVKALNDALRRQGMPLLTLSTKIIDHSVEDQIELGDEP